MDRKQIFFSRSWIAALTLSLCATSCVRQPEAEAQDQAFATQLVEWEEQATAEGCKINAMYPDSTSNTALSNNVREWINETLGGRYQGSLNNGHQVLAYYGNAHVADLKDMLDELGGGTAMDAASYYAQFKVAYETAQFVTYSYDSYIYSGGAHGSSSVSGAVFRKSDGRRFGWDMFTAEGKEALRKLLKEALMKQYYKTNDEEDFYTKIFDADARYSFPLPQTPPLLKASGVFFVYQEYELSAYVFGTPQCTIPYERLRDCLTTTMTPLLDSVNDSIAQNRPMGLSPQ